MHYGTKDNPLLLTCDKLLSRKYCEDMYWNLALSLN